MNPTTIAIVIFVCILSGVIQNVAGFGASVVMMLVFPRFFSVVTSATLSQAVSCLMTIILAVRYRKYLEFKKVLVPMLSFMFASVVTISSLKKIDLHWLGAAFGVFLVVLALYSLILKKKIKVKPTIGVAICFGLISGMLSGLFSIGATLMALYFLSLSEDRNHYMGNLQTQLACCNMISVFTRIRNGIYTADLILPTAIGMVGLLLGHAIGRQISGKLNTQKLNQFIYFLVLVTGVETFIKQISYIIK